MCGRYFIEIKDSELQDILCSVQQKLKAEPEQLTLDMATMSSEPVKDIFPSDFAPVMTGDGQYTLMKWGFSGFDSKLIINARSETAGNKPMFQKHMAERRCLIPASGYYEWKKDGKVKQKYTFKLPNGERMYMAGCFRKEENADVNTFVILTQEAGEGIRFIHDRMPVILRDSEVGDWLRNGKQKTEPEVITYTAPILAD